jgi:hypothetical protein
VTVDHSPWRIAGSGHYREPCWSLASKCGGGLYLSRAITQCRLRLRRANEHIEGDGPTVFAHACKMGLEGIVSKRRDSVAPMQGRTFGLVHGAVRP